MSHHSRHKKRQRREKSVSFESLELRQVLSSSGAVAVEIPLDVDLTQGSPTTGIDVGEGQNAADRAVTAQDSAPGAAQDAAASAANGHGLTATDVVFATHVEEITVADVSATGDRDPGGLESGLPSDPESNSAGTEFVFATIPEEELTDYQVGCLIAEKNEAGLQELLARSGGRIEGYLRSHFGLAQEDVEEALQDGLVRVWKYYEPSRGKSVGAFFVLCADSAAKDILRRHDYPADAISLSSISSPPFRQNGLSAESQVDLKNAVDAALDQLTAREREVIQADLHAGGRASNKELARTFDLTSGAITRARCSAHAKLRRLLADFAPAMGD